MYKDLITPAIVQCTTKTPKHRFAELSELADNYSNNKQNQNRNDSNSYNPICSHPVVGVSMRLMSTLDV